MLRNGINDKVKSALGCTLKDASLAVDTVFQTIMEELAAGNSVKITGFGTFKVRRRKPRKGVNPRDTTQKIQLPESWNPAFKAGKTLKDRVSAAHSKSK